MSLSQKHRAKISAALRGRPKPPRTDEHKRRLTEAAQRRDPATIKFDHLPHGRLHTADTKQKIAEYRRAHPMPSDVIAKAGRNKSAKAIARFWGRVDQSDRDGCWLWLGPTDKDGYGECSFEGFESGAHRVAYALINGGVPVGLHVLHHCDNPPCCRPDHLYAGTEKDNARDRETRGRGGNQYSRRQRS